MKIVVFTHPRFLPSQSMPRFANMLADGARRRGHQVHTLTAAPYFYQVFKNTRWAKWAGYADQYLVFPFMARRQVAKQNHSDTIYVFCDQALGPWVPITASLPHVIHAHDLLALRAALGNIPENPTSRTGVIYQKFIRQGFQKGKNFICVSKQTRSELEQFGHVQPSLSRVVYNGLNFPYCPLDSRASAQALAEAGLPVEPGGMILHVGGNQWYKNTAGVLGIYGEYLKTAHNPLPLWLVGPPLNSAAQKALQALPEGAPVKSFRGLSNLALQAAYSRARCFLFPSLAEGFGWPLVEAQACGCPVITTNAAPMNEVAGPHSGYLPKLDSGQDAQQWAEHGATLLNRILQLTPEARSHLVQQGLKWVEQFDSEHTLDQYFQIYEEVLAQWKNTAMTDALTT